VHFAAVAIFPDEKTFSTVSYFSALGAQPAPGHHSPVGMIEEPIVEKGLAGERFCRTAGVKGGFLGYVFDFLTPIGRQLGEGQAG
jgi:hypothetical protein